MIVNYNKKTNVFLYLRTYIFGLDMFIMIHCKNDA